MEVNVLDILDKLDEFRRSHQNETQNPTDWCMRCMEAIVAEAAGYTNRNDWTDALKGNPESRYSRDLQDQSIRF